MKFDLANASLLARQIEETLADPAAGLSQALDRLADVLDIPGWHVERSERPLWVKSRRAAGTSQAWLVLSGLVMAVYFGSSNTWLHVIGLIVAALGLVSLGGAAASLGAARGQLTDVISAKSIATASEPRPRLVVLTRIATISPRLVGRRRWLWALIVMVQAVILNLHPAWPYQVLAWLFVIGSLVVMAFDLWPNEGKTGSPIDGKAMALMVELARSWPKLANSRVDARFVVLAGSVDGLLEWSELTDAKTLLIEIEALGRGSKLRLAGSDEVLELAQAAATDLWVPHVASLQVPALPLAGEATPAFLKLEGDHEKLDDPTLLARAGQLIVELALRWGKR